MIQDVLTTRRLVLRPLLAKDAQAMTMLVGDYEVSKWLTVVPYPYSRSDADWFIRSAGNMPGENWAITVSDNLIGMISHTKELGYWLGRPFWRQGYMAEAANAVVGAVFAQGAQRSIGSGYFPGNAGSSAILTNLGFRKTYVEMANARAQNCEVPVQKMKLTRSDWRAHPNQSAVRDAARATMQ